MAVTIMNTRNWRCEAQHIMMGERVKKEEILCVCAGHYFRKIKFYQEIVNMLISHKKFTDPRNLHSTKVYRMLVCVDSRECSLSDLGTMYHAAVAIIGPDRSCFRIL